jgi:hypothetical protein
VWYLVFPLFRFVGLALRNLLVHPLPQKELGIDSLRASLI